MINIVLLGGPGAGKGTQAENIMRRYGIPQISTGEIFRENIRNGTELGKSAKSYMDRGALVPDEVTVNLVEDRLSQPDCANGYILDGFPRNIAQAEALDKYLAAAGCGLKAVVDIYVSDENIVGRLSGRRVCRDCGKSYHFVYNPPADANVCDKCGGAIIQRDDDKEETVRERLRVYHAQTAPLIDYYQKTGVFMQITGRELVEDTTAEMFAALEAVLSK